MINPLHYNTPLILIVDDDATMRVIFRHALSHSGFQIIEAADGELALTAFQSQRPDIVLLDVLMPQMNGYQVCRQLRTLPGAEHTPILMLTGLDDVESIDAAYQAGATDFITKPINYTLLGHRIRYVLRASRAMVDLNKSQTRLAHAQALAHIGNWEWDALRDRVLCSEEIVHFLALPAAQVTRAEFLHAMYPEDRSLIEQAWHTACETGAPYSLDHRIGGSASSPIRIVHQQGEVSYDELHRVTQISGILQDITERKQVENELKHYRNRLEELVEKRTTELTIANNELQMAKEQAEQANALKDKFISLVAHDLRSPLASMITALEYMSSDEETHLAEEHQEITQRLITIGKSSIHLIEDVLNISRLKTGKLTLNWAHIDLHQKIEKVIYKLNFLAQQKDIILINAVPPSVYIHADAALLGEVLLNLTSNAIKFCHKGDHVRFHLVADDPCQFAVADTGIGIPAEKLPRIFSIEEKTSTPGTAGEKGTGFGLPFCHDIIVAHGGQLRVESALTVGTTFFIQLPAQVPAHACIS